MVVAAILVPGSRSNSGSKRGSSLQHHRRQKHKMGQTFEHGAEHSADGRDWPVHAALRPGCKSGYLPSPSSITAPVINNPIATYSMAS